MKIIHWRLDMKRILSKIPGFRSNVLWKKVLSIIIHLILVIILSFLLTGIPNDVPIQDYSIYKAINAVGAITFIIIPYVLIGNLFGIRLKLPLYKSTKFIPKAVAILLTVFLCTGMFGIISNQLSKGYSDTYKAQLEKERLESEAEQAKKDKLSNEIKQKKEQEAQAKKRSEEEAKKKLADEVEAKKKSELEAKKKAEAEKAAIEKAKKDAEIKVVQDKKAKEDAEKQAIIAFGKERGIEDFELAKIAYNRSKEVQKIVQNAKIYDYRELMKAADTTLKDKSISLYGKITFIKESTDMSGDFNGTLLILEDDTGNAYGAFYPRQHMSCLEGDYIQIYGLINGYNTVTNSFGAKREVPDIEVVDYE